MSVVTNLADYKAKKERAKQIEAVGGPCKCGVIMEACGFHSDPKNSTQYLICPSCFNFRVNYEVN